MVECSTSVFHGQCQCYEFYSLCDKTIFSITFMLKIINEMVDFFHAYFLMNVHILNSTFVVYRQVFKGVVNSYQRQEA